MMDQYCKDEYQKRSLKDELLTVQRQNQIIMRGLPPEAKEKSNILWLHAFDFQRWFQTYIIYFIY